MGLEATPEEHIEKLVVGFREVRRVLRDDGVIFLNYGDKYSNAPLGRFTGGSTVFEGRDLEGYIQSGTVNTAKASGLPQGNLIGLAWHLALALQADGWYLRSDIIWAKALSFCEKYSGSTMPESVNGWRWERHRVKVSPQKSGGRNIPLNPENWNKDTHPETRIKAQYTDCPGCEKCDLNDGLVLRKGSWRPTRAHEYLFLLAKSPNYFCDMEAVREEWADGRCGNAGKYDYAYQREARNRPNSPTGIGSGLPPNASGRNLRDVWCINPQAYPESHYATFPEDLVRPCIKVATSEKGCCPECGSPWARVIKSSRLAWKPDPNAANYACPNSRYIVRPESGFSGTKSNRGYVESETLGWRPTCKHGKDPVPCVVLDPFGGSCTTLAEAARLGRDYIGIELNKDYIEEQGKFRIQEAETGVTIDEQKAGQLGLFP